MPWRHREAQAVNGDDVSKGPPELVQLETLAAHGPESGSPQRRPYPQSNAQATDELVGLR
jgi:hypothetical protein